MIDNTCGVCLVLMLIVLIRTLRGDRPATRVDGNVTFVNVTDHVPSTAGPLDDITNTEQGEWLVAVGF